MRIEFKEKTRAGAGKNKLTDKVSSKEWIGNGNLNAYQRGQYFKSSTNEAYYTNSDLRLSHSFTFSVWIRPDSITPSSEEIIFSSVATSKGT
jgi:hypothetical protein